jgi:alkylation response protein AidB-like acyl-CoA dehydrogenase
LQFAAKWDEESYFPIETYKKTAELGFAGLLVKDDVGGTALSRFRFSSIFLMFIYLIIYLLFISNIIVYFIIFDFTID